MRQPGTGYDYQESVTDSMYEKSQINQRSNEYFDQAYVPILDQDSYSQMQMQQQNYQQHMQNFNSMQNVPDNVMAANIVAGGVVVSRQHHEGATTASED